MNRAMFSGVSGLKTHQIKMDVIGNNIANVNTFGYKSQRAVFSDIFYQTLASASAGTTSRGGTNPSSVGYGTKLAGIQTNISPSSMQSTGYGLDIAIAGEGFLQVMDPDGNIFYTRAGLLDYDANGYLTDINGNFVLGKISADGTPDSKKIKLDNIGSVAAQQAKAKVTINGVEYTMTAASSNEKGNVTITIGSSDSLAAGQKAKATISTTGAITVLLNKNEKFTDLAALNSAINAAITEANGGKAHPAGNFTLSASKNVFPTGGLTGAEIAQADFAVQPGTVTGTMLYNIKVLGTSSTFIGEGTVSRNDGTNTHNFTATYHAASGSDPAYFEVSMNINGRIYTGNLKDGETASSMLLKNATDGDYLEISNPGYTNLFNAADGDGSGAIDGTETGVVDLIADGTSLTVTKAKVSNNLGLSSSAFSLEGGTAGGAITLDQLTSIAIGSDGTISVTHPNKGTVVAGKISLANFANPAGLQLEGTNYFSKTVNSGEPKLCDPGANGTGTLVSSALEMSNVDLSAEFAEMITTQRGFQANSRIITVSDTMLEELINLKR
ncbi:MAG: flagellar hook-basal body complex protein [Clostridiales bacterium]|nr:flagellar hook-basal body complex protein [Clostridiales bacterium]